MVKTPKEVASRYHYMINLLDTLRAFGGVAKSKEVYLWFIEQGIARQSDLDDQQLSKESRFVKEVRFARLLLAYGGLVDGPSAIWRLTPNGWDTYLDLEGARALSRRSSWPQRPKSKSDLGRNRTRKFAARSGPSKGPRPVGWSRMVQREVSGPASAYVMRFADSTIWKVGYASNVTARLAELNRHVPTELLNQRWALVHERRWVNQDSAYTMEQRLLGALVDYRTTGERVNCPEDLLLAAWREAEVSR